MLLRLWWSDADMDKPVFTLIYNAHLKQQNINFAGRKPYYWRYMPFLTWAWTFCYIHWYLDNMFICNLYLFFCKASVELISPSSWSRMSLACSKTTYRTRMWLVRHLVIIVCHFASASCLKLSSFWYLNDYTYDIIPMVSRHRTSMLLENCGDVFLCRFMQKSMLARSLNLRICHWITKQLCDHVNGMLG